MQGVVPPQGLIADEPQLKVDAAAVYFPDGGYVVSTPTKLLPRPLDDDLCSSVNFWVICPDQFAGSSAAGLLTVPNKYAYHCTRSIVSILAN